MAMFNLKNHINRLCRVWLNQRNRQRLTNKTPTVLASNCIGGFMLHDLNLRFHSPFVNLFLKPTHFIRYLQNIAFYQQQPLQFIESEKPYPVGKLDDIEIHFMHYRNPQDAAKKWQQRTARMDFDNLFIIMVERDGCTYQDLVEFDKLPFKHKVVFTHKPYPEIASAVYIQGFETQHQVRDLFAYTGLFGKKYYDQFDYVGWFNGSEHHSRLSKTLK